MVSSRRVASPTSSLSSYGSSCEYQQACKTTLADGHKDLEQLSVDDDREVARRVLADLEELYFDEDSDGGSGDEDKYESSSEWESETSPCSSRGKRNAGGMTLEELTVAVNAAIEYHRPAKAVVEQPAIAPKSKEDDNLSQYSKDHRPRSRRRHQRKDPPTMSSPTGDSVLELFQDMLERKEKHFHALRAESVNAVAKDNQSRETVTSRTVKVDQQQQTTAYVRDQATETEEYSHRRSLDAEFGVAEFDIPPLSLLSSVHSEYDATPSNLVRPIEVGPMLADLTHIQERHRLSSRPHPASESSWGSSSSSSATNSSFQSSFSSEHSSRSSTIKCVSSRHCHNSTKSSSKARRTSPPSNKSSSSSNHSSRKSQHHAEGEPAIETIEPTDVQSALAQKDQPEEGFQTAVSHLPVDQSQVPSSPELVEWELDLSNFAF
ncbi:hypothetical protein PC116_g6136 [Phytophthora cactorum]|uniref:Uncharacterized protein n=1 Tax=Phytophthora cactorum TaxID=29920 RepID=A0A8T1C974_9STRA|nr:hypothetical protein Pcac1_g584 [Phytophthora cactorum]KAG2810406.1 hypothetical protein PC112_g16058 [Phytophthora cactorum]KAG2902474.1 hypothetical protein PC115_g15579 [Phytophthora cactorum]KAG2918113.1 hypothetical protein PC117_g17192 [Phytophthora cactorum]KAG4246065.1 hypothetical protein PC116_g6136 [Phytophthora cactorum]